MVTGLIQLIVVLIVLGIIWYFLAQYIAEPFKTILMVVIILAFCIWLLEIAGLLPGFRLVK